tara:strand:- start:110721 stop:111704 length:984 start_codon:yes stop_codon:yes gene_type:complete
MTVAVEKDDYIIVKHRNNKPTLCFVLNAKTKRAVIEKTLLSDEPEHITYEDEKLLCNLGPNPQHGKIYGVDVTPYKDTIETKRFGPILLFRDLDKKELKALRKAMKSVFDMFEKEASTAFLPLYQIHLLPKKGKYAGVYIAKTKGSEVYDQIKLHPESFADPIYNEYLIAHEFAHGLWYRCVPLELRVKWMKLYQKRLKLSSIDEKHLGELCHDVVRYEGGIRDYMKEVADDDEKLVIKEVLTYFKKYHSMAAQDVDLMLAHDSGKLADMWPTRALLSESRPDISQYSMTKVEEFFAEAVAYHFSGRQLPKDVAKGLKATFAKAKLV